ncbi:hypothetical protein [Nocardia brevicatena]|uniref:hypothetical protein n=1 Tax=Nocardia brevicatena TaxID=37327 RepID=UPI0002FE5920|nr:hypothetical protein [Nocardia brevicatena]
MDQGIDTAAQDDPEWVVWSSPQRIQAAVDKLFGETLPRIPADWKVHTGSAEPIGPMPMGIDRYSDEMALHWIDDAFDYFFPGEDSVFEPDNAEIVDQFVCYIGEYFVRHCDGRWINDPEAGVLHDFGPTICYDWTSAADFPMNLLLDSVEQGFEYATLAWHARTVEHEAHGLPHEGRELRHTYGRG